MLFMLLWQPFLSDANRALQAFKPLPTGSKLAEIRHWVKELNDRTKFVDLALYLDQLEADYGLFYFILNEILVEFNFSMYISGTLVLDDQMPSFYTYRGVAAHHLQDVDRTEAAFRNGTKAFPNDHRAWINLGETCIHQFKMDEAIEAFSQAWALGEASTPYRLLKAKVKFVCIHVFYELTSLYC